MSEDKQELSLEDALKRLENVVFTKHGYASSRKERERKWWEEKRYIDKYGFDSPFGNP